MNIILVKISCKKTKMYENGDIESENPESFTLLRMPSMHNHFRFHCSLGWSLYSANLYGHTHVVGARKKVVSENRIKYPKVSQKNVPILTFK
jgi:hypothetical protein